MAYEVKDGKFVDVKTVEEEINICRLDDEIKELMKRSDELKAELAAKLYVRNELKELAPEKVPELDIIIDEMPSGA